MVKYPKYEILLINIVRDTDGFSRCFQESIGQYCIASFLELFNFKAYVYNGTIKECKAVIEEEIEKNLVPIIGFYSAYDNFRVVKNTIKWLKSNFDVTTIVGGPQADAIDINFFKETNNDFAILGEGEIPVKLLLDHIIDKSVPLSEIHSLLYVENDELIYNPNTNNIMIKDLDLISYPKMKHSLHNRLRQYEMAGILTGRGCPFNCAFCYEGITKNVRFRSVENVIEEILYIKKHNKNLKYINIYDDTFTINKERVLEFCKEFKKHNIKWFCEGHVSFVVQNPEIIKEMVDSGLTCIQFGIESGSNDVLQAYNKRITKDMIIQAIKICKEAGILAINGNFIVGGAIETRETFEESKKLFAELLEIGKGIIEIFLVYFAPYPNTQIVKNPQKFDLEINQELMDYNLNSMCSPVVSSSKFSTPEIFNLMQEFKKFREEVYEKGVISSTKSDFLQGMYENNKLVIINRTWYNAYFSKETFSNFAKHLNDDEQIFNEDKYIIRTFEDFYIDGNSIITEAGEFTNLDKDVLLYSTGLYSAKKISKILNITIDELKNIYNKLNNKCLVYMSDF